MKILLVTGSLNQGGAEYQLLALALLLQKKGHQVEVLALTDYDHFLPFVREHSIPYSCISNEGNRLSRLYRAVKAILQKKPLLVISYIKLVSQVAIIARVLSGFRFKLIISERTSLIKPLHDLYYFNLALLANHITVNSISKIEYIQKRFPLLKNRVSFMPNIIDVIRFESSSHLGAERHINNQVKLVYVGRLSPEKNLINLLEAVAELLRQNYQIELRLVGEAKNKPYFDSLMVKISELNLSSNVVFAGSTKDVAAEYSAADLMCLPSYFEGFSNVLSEAISSGLPVIASDIPENRFLIEDGVNGFLVNPYQPNSIAKGIERFLQLSLSSRVIMSKNNREKALEIFDENQVYKKYTDLITKIGVINPGIL